MTEFCADKPWEVLNQTKEWRLSQFTTVLKDEWSTKRVSSRVNGHSDMILAEHIMLWLEKNAYYLWHMCNSRKEIIRNTVSGGYYDISTRLAFSEKAEVWIKNTPLYRAAKEEFDKTQAVKLTVEFPNGDTEVRYLQEGEGFTIKAPR